jgi:hypothetical protein
MTSALNLRSVPPAAAQRFESVILRSHAVYALATGIACRLLSSGNGFGSPQA